MSLQAMRILMLTPFHKKKRGNSVTSIRLHNGLQRLGYNVDLFSLEADNYRSLLAQAIASRKYALVHAFHATYCGQVLDAVPETRELPLLLTSTGTDLHCDLTGNGRTAVLDAFNTARKIIVFNKDFYQIIRENCHEALPKLRTIPQGGVLGEGKIVNRTQLGIAEHKFVFLLPSGLRPV
ncbi:MAG: hypothetical protein PHC92_06250, partial [Syntrophomonadaceae bacterium]|nr:hypothetical protein [Syntrophomonadaceae bacterium]